MTQAKNPVRYDSEKHCGGTTRAGTKCTRPKGWGTVHSGFGNCKLHFGSTEPGIKHGQLEAAGHAAQLLHIPVATNPYDSLKQLEAEAMGYVEYFRREVQRLDPDCIFVRPTSILRRPIKEEKGAEDPSVEVEEITEAPYELNIAIKAHQKAMEDLRRISKTVFDVNLADRFVKLQEEDDHTLALFARDLVLALGLKQTAAIQGIVRKQLIAIDATVVEESEQTPTFEKSTSKKRKS